LLGDVKEDIGHPEPPGYRLKEPRPKPKIGPYLERIAQIIQEDKALPKKQRHTAKPLVHRVGEAQVDFGYALASWRAGGVATWIIRFVLFLDPRKKPG